jgi:hypothetical protein
VFDHVPFVGLYNSEFVNDATSTSPFGSNVAVWLARAFAIGPVFVTDVAFVLTNICVTADPMAPPVTSTFPLGSSVAVE